MKKLIGIILAVLISSSAYAASWYAGPSGSGTACTSGTPCTLEYAIETKASSGDTVYAQDGIHNTAQIEIPDGVDLTSASGIAANVVIRPNQTMDTNTPLLLLETAAGSTNAVGNDISYVSFNGVGIARAQLAIRIKGRDGVRVHHCIFEDFTGTYNAGAVETRGNGTPTPEYWDPQLMPVNPGVVGDDSAMLALWTAAGLTDSVKNVEIDNNIVSGCGWGDGTYQTGAFTYWNGYNILTHDNDVDLRDTAGGQAFAGLGLKTSCLNASKFYNNQVSSSNITQHFASSSSNYSAGEFWVMLNCEFYGNTGAGEYGSGGFSITNGKGTKFYDNHVWAEPETSPMQSYALEFLGQSEAEVYGNHIEKFYILMNVGMQNKNDEDYVVRNVLIRDNLFSRWRDTAIEITCRGPRWTNTTLTVTGITARNNTGDAELRGQGWPVPASTFIEIDQNDDHTFCNVPGEIYPCGSAPGEAVLSNLVVVNNIAINSQESTGNGGYFGYLKGEITGTNIISANQAFNNTNNSWYNYTESGLDTTDPNFNDAYVPQEPTTANDGGYGGVYPSYRGAFDPGSGVDTTGPIISNPSPVTALPQGTTSTEVSVAASDISGVDDCRADTTPSVAYASKSIDMSEVSGTWSFTTTGLTDGSTTVYYVECEDTLNNFSDEYPLSVSVAPNDPGTEGVIVDDADNGCTYEGSWSFGSAITGYNGSGYRYTTDSAANASDTATFTPALGVAGTYVVEIKHTAYPNRPDSVPYTVTHSGGTATGTIDQTINNGEWVGLGSYECPAGTTCKVEITGADAGYAIADAVRFTLTTGGSQPIASGAGFGAGDGSGTGSIYGE